MLVQYDKEHHTVLDIKLIEAKNITNNYNYQNQKQI